MLFPSGMTWRRFYCRWNRSSTTNEKQDVHSGVRLYIPKSEGMPLLVDVAPLHGLHVESVEDVIYFCQRHSWPDFLDAETMANHIDDFAAMPSLSWAVGGSHFCDDRIDILSAKLHGGTQDTAQTLQKGEVWKLKVGRGAQDAELGLVKEFTEARVQLRLDGNRQCTAAHALALAKLAREHLDFFEEPGPEAWAQLVKNRTPLAVDETLFELWNQQKLAHAIKEYSTTTWIVKPSQYGWRGTQEVMAAAKENGVRLVVSATYEVGETASRLASFAQQAAPKEAHGLGTGVFLAPIRWETCE